MTAMRRVCLLATTVVVVQLVPVPGMNRAAAMDAVETEIQELCRAQADFDPESSLRLEARRRERLDALGERGRTTLLKLARGKTVDRGCALYMLIHPLHDRRALPIIRKLLRDRQAPKDLKALALEGAGVLRDSESFERVLAAFRSGERTLVDPAAFALGALGDERGLRALRDALTDPQYRAALRSVIMGVGVAGHEQAIEPLLGLLTQPEIVRKDSLRSSIACSLIGIGTTRSREAALSTLGQIAEKGYVHEAALCMLHALEAQRTAATNPSEQQELEQMSARVRESW